MTGRNQDGMVREAIRELRSSDERAAPAFDAVLTRKRRVVEFDADRVIGLAVAASVIIAAGVGVAEGMSARAQLVVPHEVQLLSSWRPMTDVLLETSGSGLLTQTSPLEASMLPWTPISVEDDQ